MVKKSYALGAGRPAGHVLGLRFRYLNIIFSLRYLQAV